MLHNSNAPEITHNYSGSTLWIFGIGTMYESKAQANKDKDQHVREYIKEYSFYGKQWFIRMSSHAIKTAPIKPLN